MTGLLPASPLDQPVLPESLGSAGPAALPAAQGVAGASRCGDAHPADPNSRSTAQHLRPPVCLPQQLPRTRSTVLAQSKPGLEGSWGRRRPRVGVTGPCNLEGEEVGWALSSFILEITGSLCPAPYSPKVGTALSSSLSGLASHTRPGPQRVISSRTHKSIRKVVLAQPKPPNPKSWHAVGREGAQSRDQGLCFPGLLQPPKSTAQGRPEPSALEHLMCLHGFFLFPPICWGF